MNDTNRMLRMPDVCLRIGLSRQTVYRMIRRGQFPPGVKLTSWAVGWRATDVEAWLQSRPPPTAVVPKVG